MSEYNSSRIRAWLRLPRCFVATAINDLYPLGLREAEINHSGSNPFVWFSTPTDNDQPYVQQAVACSWHVIRCIAVP